MAESRSVDTATDIRELPRGRVEVEQQ